MPFKLKIGGGGNLAIDGTDRLGEGTDAADRGDRIEIRMKTPQVTMNRPIYYALAQ